MLTILKSTRGWRIIASPWISTSITASDGARQGGADTLPGPPGTATGAAPFAGRIAS
jgi:hypothetical protein